MEPSFSDAESAKAGGLSLLWTREFCALFRALKEVMPAVAKHNLNTSSFVR